MIVGLEVVHVNNSMYSSPQCYYKLLFPANEKSILHRWKSPSTNILDLQECNPYQYFIQNQKSPSFIHSLHSIESSKQILEYVFKNNIFQPSEIQSNYAFNIFDYNLTAVFEARLLTCFYTYQSKEIHQIYWDLFIDHLNVHFYVSSSILRRLMSSTYIGTILGFNLNLKHIKSSSSIHADLFQPRKSTVFLTINKQTLVNHFKYDNNVLHLQKPHLCNNNICFSSTPLHIGSGISLSSQCNHFQDESNMNILKLHKKKKQRMFQSRFIIICDKEELSCVINRPSSNLHLNFVSVSETKEANNNNKPSNHFKESVQSNFLDEYVILLIATNPKKSSNSSIYPKFDISDINSIKKIRHPNVNSTDGSKHNKSYGKYYGFGIINKYKLDMGISFGQFESNKSIDDGLKDQISSIIKDQFMFFVSRLHSTLKGSFEAGNDQIKSLIDYGRIATINQKFIDKTEPNQFLLNDCFSIWLCNDARTEEFHQEIDSSYTLIGIPIQKTNNTLSDKLCQYKFQFRWNPIDEMNSYGVDIGLFDGMVLYYNGIGLFHRQVPCNDNFMDNSFWNLSMYHNYRLFRSISKSINRF